MTAAKRKPTAPRKRRAPTKKAAAPSSTADVVDHLAAGDAETKTVTLAGGTRITGPAAAVDETARVVGLGP